MSADRSRHPCVEVRQRVEWPDTDAAGHYHHATVVRWVESAEAELFSRLGILNLFGAIPRVDYRVEYKRRFWFRDEVLVQLWVASVGRTSVTYGFEIRHDDTIGASGRLTAAHIDGDTGVSHPWPTEVRSRLQGAA